jgi:hypothetical protein
MAHVVRYEMQSPPIRRPLIWPTRETLAEMVGTTRSRVSFLMNRFREWGFIQCNRGLQVHSSLLHVVLHD